MLGLLAGTCVLLAALLVLVPRGQPVGTRASEGPGRTEAPAGQPEDQVGGVAGTVPPADPSTTPAAGPGRSLDRAQRSVDQADRNGETSELKAGSGTPGDGAAAMAPGVNPEVRDTEVAATVAAARPAGKICLMIDDAGYDLGALDRFLQLPWRITIAVLPGLSGSEEAARRARQAGKPVYLHAPMEPEGDEDPGPDAIRTAMDETAIRQTLTRWLEEVGPVEGINNHMGSRATADIPTMRAVLSVVADRSLVFVDSRTTQRTVARQEAARYGVSMAERDVFLDYEPGIEPIHAGMDATRRLARSRGYAVAIGHTQNPLLADYLAAVLPALEREGFVIVSPAEIARGREVLP